MMKRILTIAFCACSALWLLSLAMPAVMFAQAADATKVQVSQKDPHGKFLTDAKGMSLYLFEADSKNTATCYDACAKAWPPLLTEGTPTAGDQVDAAMLSAINRKDGSTQVTYNGWPLYYFVKDKASGDTKGQDVEGFGAEWYLVSPEGNKVHD
jgi:predicted lipoprotein with Yx(FWY)xxD motif